MEEDIDRILLTEDQLAARVAELAHEIANTYPNPAEGLTLVTVLSGSIIFLADLIRHLPIKMKIGLITVSSYPGASTASRGATLLSDLSLEVNGRDVLVIDDILDTGTTLRLGHGSLRERNPRSVRTAVLLRKKVKAPPDVVADFVGFDIDDVFVVGYGLDFDDHYRNLPHIAVLKPEVYAAQVS